MGAACSRMGIFEKTPDYGRVNFVSNEQKKSRNNSIAEETTGGKHYFWHLAQ